ncbi:MAG: glucose/galactose MFS transporter [Cytophagales bacterium]|nr:MAG: glucose/galactose MFS transporter [Cytophagales bacterium]
MQSLSDIRKNFKASTGFFDKIILALLFFIWGCLTQLNDITLPYLYDFGLGFSEALALQFTFFASYLLMSYPAAKLIDKLGYKNGIYIGLLLSAFGSIYFYIITGSTYYQNYLIALFIIGSGVALLQIAGNGYVVLSSDTNRAASNLTFLQIFNSVGRLGVLLVSTSLFFIITGMTIDELYSLGVDEYLEVQTQHIRMPYLWMALLIFLTAVLIYFSKLPEIKTNSLPVLIDNGRKQITSVFAVKHTILGAIAIFAYVGAEVAIGSYLVQYVSLPNVGGRFFPEKEALKMIQYYWGSALVGRIIGGFILRDISLRKVTTGFAIAAAIFALVSIITSGKIAIVTIIAIGFFNSILFPAIFTLAISGLGHFAEEGAGLLITSIAGGAVVPYIIVAFAALFGLQFSFIIIVFCYIYIAFYGVYGSQYKQKTL